MSLFLVVEVGYLNRDRSDLREWSVVPNYGVGGAMHYSGKRDIFKLSMVTLNPGLFIQQQQILER